MHWMGHGIGPLPLHQEVVVFRGDFDDVLGAGADDDGAVRKNMIQRGTFDASAAEKSGISECAAQVIANQKQLAPCPIESSLLPTSHPTRLHVAINVKPPAQEQHAMPGR